MRRWDYVFGALPVLAFGAGMALAFLNSEGVVSDERTHRLLRWGSGVLWVAGAGCIVWALHLLTRRGRMK